MRQRDFRWLWLGVLISSTGTWMQTVGAQWLLVDAPNVAALVALVSAANTLPVMMLALPGGVLADTFDRRWLLSTVQAYFFIVGILLTVLTAAGQMSPALLLTFTFALDRLADSHNGGHSLGGLTSGFAVRRTEVGHRYGCAAIGPRLECHDTRDAAIERLIHVDW